jgi:glycosyltransferase involved in cell wall biosynthesis
MEKLVSIVITCYNYGRYLRESLASALAQTYARTEIVVVDDGSTDETAEVVKEFLAHGRLVSIRQENAGQARSKNAGIRASKGDFIAFLDADDRWMPEKIEKQMKLFDRKAVGVAYTGRNFIDGSGASVIREGGAKMRSGWVTKHLFVDNFVPFSSSMVRRECLEDVGVFDPSLRMAIDWDLWLRMSMKYEFDFVDENLISYRIHSAQMSSNQEDRFLHIDRIRQAFLEKHPGVVSEKVCREARISNLIAKAYYYRDRQRALSNRFYRMVLRERPFSVTAAKGAIRNGCACLFSVLKGK